MNAETVARYHCSNRCSTCRVGVGSHTCESAVPTIVGVITDVTVRVLSRNIARSEVAMIVQWGKEVESGKGEYKGAMPISRGDNPLRYLLLWLAA